MKKMLETNLVDQIYSLLKEKIISCELKTGQRIDINGLTRELNVSQTPIREVVNRLTKEGLVANIPQKGFYVVKLEKVDLEEIYELRQLIECYALEYAIQNVEVGKFQELLSRIKSLRKLINNNKQEENFNSMDEELHFAIVNNSSNRRLRQIYSETYDVIKIIKNIGDSKLEYSKYIDEHIELIEAILEKNLSNAKRILKTHINGALKRVVQTIDNISDSI